MITLDSSLILGAMLGSLGGLITAALLLYIGWMRFKPKLIRTWEDYLANRLQQERAQFGSEIQTRVSDGVREGIADGIAAIPSTQVLRRTRQTMAKTGREIVGSGFQTLFGKRPSRQATSDPNPMNFQDDDIHQPLKEYENSEKL